MRLPTVLLLSILPLAAQDAPAPPADAQEPLPIAPITPVPLPTDADIAAAAEVAPAKPTSVTLDFAAGADYVKATETLTFRGPVKATADTGMTLNARGGRYEGLEKKLFLDGPVKLRTETGVEIFSDHAVLDDTTRTVTLTGDISIYQNQTLQRGERIVYFIDTGLLDTTSLRTGVDPLLLEADGFVMDERDGKRVFVGRDAGVTTHDVEDPDFWIRASETTVYPGDRVTFSNLKLYAGDTPVFWLPYFSQPLDSQLGYHIIPGARSNWGPYLLNSYGIMLGEGKDPWLLSRWNFDLRGRRGVGLGVDLIDRRQKDNENLTGLSLYYANDLDPTISRTGLPRGIVNEDRWRAALQYRIPLSLEGGDRWHVDYNLNFLSDNFYLEDFNPRLFRTDPAPDNTIGLIRRDEHSLFSLVTRIRPNDFYRSDTRLPEIAYDQSRRSIFGAPIFHEGTTSFTIAEEEIGSFTQGTAQAAIALPPGSPLLPNLLNQLPTYERLLVQRIRALPPGSPLLPALTTQLLDPGYNRFHTLHQFSAPMKIGGWLNFSPEVGVGFTQYNGVSGPGDAISRTHLYAGAEASVKFARDFANHQNRFWGLDGLLHVFQPYARFSYLTTDDLDSLFPAIDRDTFTIRPRTLSPSRFTAIDSLRDWSIFRLGMRNELITKRDGQSYQWMRMDTYLDAYMEDPEGLNRSVSNLYNDFTWRPLPWLDLLLETQFPIIDDGSGFSEVAAAVRFMPNENLEITIANQFLNNHPVITDSNRINVRTYGRLNDHWGLGATHVWELDDGTLEFQQYTVHRDFNHWVASVGLTARDNRIENEYGVFLAFTLKDFPGASLPLNLDAQ